MRKNLFNEEEREFIKNNVNGRSLIELTKMFNDKFNKNIKKSQIQSYKIYNKIKSNYCNFKNGDKPHNILKIGEIYKGKNGYVYIKVSENKWELYHRYLYKKYIGEIPDDMVVIFLDGNKHNFELDNLMLVNKTESLIAFSHHLCFDDKELTKTGLMIAKLINETAKRRKNENKVQTLQHDNRR